ncbi:MAG: ribbon-helix-helix protein, CopG family [bacterium]|nr:ribbon-helix-helix protein, CopG family [bacterium]
MKVKTVNISLPEQLLVEIDQKAREEYRSRSELLKEAAVFYIRTKSNWSVLQSDIATKAKKLGIKSEDDVEKMVDSERT